MAIAALIVSILALIASLICLSFMLAKNFFSTHTVQYVPLDTEVDSGHGGPGIPKPDPFKKIGEPLTPEEEKYFKEQNGY